MSQVYVNVIKVFVKFLLILLKHKLEDADEFECCSSDFWKITKRINSDIY